MDMRFIRLGQVRSIGDKRTTGDDPMTDGFYFEDMPVGRVLHSARSIRMERDRMVAFAEEFDPQPAHLTEADAASSQFGQLCASGWHTGGVTMRLVAETLAIARGGMGLGVDNLRWPRPVLPGDTLRVSIEVLAARPSKSQPGRGLVTTRTTTFNQHDQPVQELTSVVMMPLRSAG
jgi:acyl dehydratase